MLKVDINLLQEVHYQLRRQAVRLNAVADSVNTVSRRLSACGTSFRVQEASLAGKLEELRQYAEQLQALCYRADDLAELYARCENQLRDADSRVRRISYRAEARGQNNFIEPEVFNAALEEWIGSLLSDLS